MIYVGHNYWAVIRYISHTLPDHFGVENIEVATVFDPDPDGVRVVITTRYLMTLDKWCFCKHEDAECLAAELTLAEGNA